MPDIAAFRARLAYLPSVRQVFEINTFGVMAANRAIVPHMRGRRAGTIINVTSSVGIAPMPLVAAYAASKCAVEGFSESLAYELRTLGIRVKVVQPGSRAHDQLRR